METWVALLYSVVISKGRRVDSGALIALAEGLGFRDSRTLAATGNLIFAAEGSARALEAQMEAALDARFGRRIPVVLRNASGWRRLVAGNPFRSEADAAPASVHVRVMRNGMAAEALPSLEAARRNGERLRLVEGDLWLHLPTGASGSRLAAAAGRPGLGVGTFRNGNTARRLAAMLP